ncbi:MAG: caspase family protein [Pseudomonadota bacterium]
MRLARIISATLTLLAFALSGGAHAKQVALVVANAEYQHTSKLANPLKDANLVSTALKQAGFDTVELGTNLTRAQFMERLRAFRSAADGAEAALVYFAGHGIESDGRNWLLPTDTKLDAEKDLPFEAVELQLLLDTLDGARLRIAVLDACRNNPYENRWTSENRSVTRGLAPFEMDDMLVIYAAAPGQVAYDGADGNSPFALALARRLVQPGLPVQMLGGMVRDDVLAATKGEQRPFISASMTGRPLFLVEGPQTEMAWLSELYAPEGAPDTSTTAPKVDFVKVADTLAMTRGVSDVSPEWLDEETWLKTLQADTIPAYQAYLAQFPDGLYAPYAKANVKQLLDPTATKGELNSDKPWIISLGAALPNRYAVDLGEPLAIDGVWRLSTNGKRMRIERGRAFAVDGWNFGLVFKVKPEQVTMVNLRESEPGVYEGRDILLNGDSQLTLRADGNLDVRIGTFPFPTKFVMIREGLDDPDALPAQ